MKRLVTALAVIVLAGGGAAPALAGGGTTTDTQHFTNMVESDTVPDCNGNGQFTETFVSSGVMHTTQLRDGTFHFTVTAQGTDTLVPSDPSFPTYSGHFAFWDGDNLTNTTDISTFTQTENLKGTDGSILHFHIVGQMAMGTNGGPPMVDFAHSHCFQ